MASVTLTVSDVRQAGGKVFVHWNDGVVQEFNSLADAVSYRDGLFRFGRELARQLAIARYLRVDPTGSNPSLIEGHSITLTDENNTMASVS